MASRFPSESLFRNPKLLYTLSPTAPAFTSSSSCFTVFLIQPSAPAPSKLILQNSTKRPGYLAFALAKALTKSSPVLPLKLTIT